MSDDCCVEFCRVLADETRQRILELLRQREMCVGEIAAVFAVSQPTISHHLSILRQFGLVTRRKEGQQIYYTLNRDRVAECCGRLVARFDVGAETYPGEHGALSGRKKRSSR